MVLAEDTAGVLAGTGEARQSTDRVVAGHRAAVAVLRRQVSIRRTLLARMRAEKGKRWVGFT